MTGHLLPAAESRAHRSLSAAAVITASATTDAAAAVAAVTPPPSTPRTYPLVSLPTSRSLNVVRLFSLRLPVATTSTTAAATTTATAVARYNCAADFTAAAALAAASLAAAALTVVVTARFATAAEMVEEQTMGRTVRGWERTGVSSCPPDRAEKSGLPPTRKRRSRCRQINLLATYTKIHIHTHTSS